MQEVRHWLDSPGLGQYAEAFEDNAMEWEIPGGRDHDVLEDMGIAATGRAWLWRREDRTEAAGALLRPVHESFTEGLMTPGLIEARTLQDALDT